MTRRYVIFKVIAIASVCLASISRAQERTTKEDFLMELIPDGAAIQYAGNIGMISAGPVWCYGRHDRWESSFLLGFVPRCGEIGSAATFTIKENFSPWVFSHEILSFDRFQTSIAPVRLNLSYNMITGKDFWHTHSRKDKDKFDYYQFSSRARFNIGLGSGITFSPKQRGNSHIRNIMCYYEFTTYDLLIRNAICNKSISICNIITLGLGVQVRFL